MAWLHDFTTGSTAGITTVSGSAPSASAGVGMTQDAFTRWQSDLITQTSPDHQIAALVNFGGSTAKIDSALAFGASAGWATYDEMYLSPDGSWGGAYQSGSDGGGGGAGDIAGLLPSTDFIWLCTYNETTGAHALYILAAGTTTLPGSPTKSSTFSHLPTGGIGGMVWYGSSPIIIRKFDYRAVADGLPDAGGGAATVNPYRRRPRGITYR